MKCSCESHQEFQPILAEGGLPAIECSGCKGWLMQLNDYRLWRDAVPDRVDGGTPPEVVADSALARMCPSCGHFMSRYRVTVDAGFHLDRCTTCQSVWFDRGEWEALRARGLADALDHVLSDAWQRQVRESEALVRLEAHYRERFSSEVYDELLRVRAWLDQQPRRRELLGLLAPDAKLPRLPL